MSELQIGAAVVVHPGDHVLVAVGRELSVQTAHEYKKRLLERFPDNEFTIISASQIAVFPSDGAS